MLRLPRVRLPREESLRELRVHHLLSTGVASGLGNPRLLPICVDVYRCTLFFVLEGTALEETIYVEALVGIVVHSPEFQRK